MTEPTTEPRLIRTTFTFDFDNVTGPAFRPAYARVDMLSETVEVKVKLDNGLPYVSNVRVWGQRAKKNGTASVLPAMADFYSPANTCPPHIQAVMAEAIRLTRDLLMGSGEVTV